MFTFFIQANKALRRLGWITCLKNVYLFYPSKQPTERTASWIKHLNDLEAGEWRFTVSKTKTPHIVPLSTQAIALLNDLHALTGHCDYVFAINKNAPMSDGTVNKALRRLGWITCLKNVYLFYPSKQPQPKWTARSIFKLNYSLQYTHTHNHNG